MEATVSSCSVAAAPAPHLAGITGVLSETDGFGAKVVALRRPDTCASCARPLDIGTRAGWDATTRTAHRLECVAAATEPGSKTVPAAVPQLRPAALRLPSAEATSSLPAVEQHRAGASAQAEYERRSRRREERVRARFRRLGWLVLALAGEPAHTGVAQGARGERAVAAKLDDLAPPSSRCSATDWCADRAGGSPRRTSSTSPPPVCGLSTQRSTTVASSRPCLWAAAPAHGAALHRRANSPRGVTDPEGGWDVTKRGDTARGLPRILRPTPYWASSGPSRSCASDSASCFAWMRLEHGTLAP